MSKLLVNIAMHPVSAAVSGVEIGGGCKSFQPMSGSGAFSAQLILKRIPRMGHPNIMRHP